MTIKVDVTFHPEWWHKYTGVSFREEFFTDPDYRIECDIKMRKVLYEKFGDLGLGEKEPKPRPIIGSDLIASGYLFSNMMGCNVRYFDAQPPEVICANLPESSIALLEVEKSLQSQVWQQTVKQFEVLQKKFGYVESHINLQGVQNIALDLRGNELFIDYYENPEMLNKLLQVITQTMIQTGRYITSGSKVSSHGVTAITRLVMPEVYLTSNCTVEMISNDIYEEFLLPSDIQLSQEFKPFGIHHCGKSMEHVVEGYKKVKGLKFAEVGAGSNISEVRLALPEIFLNLRYSPVKIKTATENEVMTDIENMAKAAVHQYSISCVGIDSEVEDEKVRNFIQCVQSIK